MIKAATIGASVVLASVVMISAAFGSASAQTGSNATLGNVADIPAEMAVLYSVAASTFGISAPILAAIGKVECDHNRNRACDRPNSAGAAGPMQFLPSTFVAYDHASGSPDPDIYNPRDAVFAAALLLKSNGINNDARKAIWSYNHSNEYVNLVLSWANRYSGIGSGSVATVLATARSYLGTPYLWGGNGREGIDCSGLVVVSFKAAGIDLPRVAQDQSRQGIAVARLADVQPGDLLSYGTSRSEVDHITIVTDKPGYMIEAPRRGTVVREVPIRTGGLVNINRVIS